MCSTGVEGRDPDAYTHRPRFRALPREVERPMVVNGLSLLGDPGDTYQAYQLTDADYEAISAAVDDFRASDAELLQARPSKENNAIEAGIGLLKNIHDVKLDRTLMWKRNVSYAYGHEIWHDNGQVKFYWRAPNETKALDLSDKIEGRYDADVFPVDRVFPTIEPGDYVAGATIHLTDPFWKPIKSPLTERGDEDPITDDDPYGDITTDMEFTPRRGPDGDRITADDCRVVVQTMFSPARDTWSRGGRWGVNVREKAREQKKPIYSSSVFGVKEREPTADEKKAGDILQRQFGEKGYYVAMRVLVISPYQQVAQDYAREVALDYRRYYESFTNQGLAPTPATPDEIPALIAKTAHRQHDLSLRDRHSIGGKFLLNVYGLASVAHLPNKEINSAAVDWYEMETGPGVPPTADQMEDVMEPDESEADRVTTSDPNEANVPDDPTEALEELGNEVAHEAGATRDDQEDSDNEDDTDGYQLEW